MPSSQSGNSPPMPANPTRTVADTSQNFAVGENVLYFSASENKWINAKVLSTNGDGSFDLDCKPKAKADKMKRMTTSVPPAAVAATKSIGSMYPLGAPSGANHDEMRAQLLSVAEHSNAYEVQNALQMAQDAGLHGPEVIRARDALSALEAGGIKEQAMEIVDAAIESDNWWKLQSAMAMAHSTGFDKKDVDRLQEAMRMCKKRKDDVQLMREAAQRRDAAALRTAIEVSLKDYVAEKYVKPMRDELRSMEASTFVKSQLDAAIRSKSARQMQEAINAATKAGIKENDKEAGESLRAVQTELQSMALDNLHRLIEKRNVGELDMAISEWRNRGVREEALAPFSKKLEVWKKHDACRRDLEAAIRSGNPSQISSALAVADTAGMNESDLQFARLALRKHQDRERAQQQQDQERREQEEQQRRRQEQERVERENEQQRRQQEQAKLEREKEERRRKSERDKEEQRRLQQEREREQMAVNQKQAELRASAEMKLHAAMSGSDVKQLEVAIQMAQQMGLSSVELARANDVLRGIHSRTQAAQDLRIAIQSSDIYRLKAAIANARHAGVADADIADAQAHVARLQGQGNVRRTLQTAVASRNMDMIRKAIDEARRAGLPAHEIAEIEQHLHSSQESAKSALHAAMATGDPSRLRVEIGAATDAGLAQHEILAASEHLRKLEWQQSVRKELQTAMQRGDPVKLQTALQHAIAADMPDHELAHARAELGTLSQKRQLEQELQLARAGGCVDSLRAALRAAITAGLTGQLIDSATAEIHAIERATLAASAQRQAQQSQWSSHRPEAKTQSPRVTWPDRDRGSPHQVPPTDPQLYPDYSQYTVPDTAPNHVHSYPGYSVPDTNPQYGVPDTDPQVHPYP